MVYTILYSSLRFCSHIKLFFILSVVYVSIYVVYQVEGILICYSSAFEIKHPNVYPLSDLVVECKCVCQLWIIRLISNIQRLTLTYDLTPLSSWARPVSISKTRHTSGSDKIVADITTKYDCRFENCILCRNFNGSKVGVFSTIC